MKKILWILQVLPYPPDIGAKQRSFNLLRQAAKIHEVWLVVIDHEGIENEKNRSVLEGLCRKVHIVPAKRRGMVKGLMAFRSLFKRSSYAATWLFDPKGKDIVEHLLRNENFDIVHFDGIGLAPYFTQAQGIIKVLDNHNYESQLRLRRAQKERSLAGKFFFFREYKKLASEEKKFFHFFDCLLTVSAFDREGILMAYPNKRIEVVPNGVDIKYFRSTGSEPDESSVIFAGGMGWYPNKSAMLYFARDIWPRIKEKVPGIKMTLIGASPPPEITKIGQADPDFRVLGYVEDVRPYMDRSQIYVCPIFDGGGTRLKILNAMAMGKPIVSTVMAMEGIQAEQDRHYLAAEDADKFAHQIDRLVRDRELRRGLADAARRLVCEKYDFEMIGKKLAAIYDGL